MLVWTLLEREREKESCVSHSASPSGDCVVPFWFAIVLCAVWKNGGKLLMRLLLSRLLEIDKIYTVE